MRLDVTGCIQKVMLLDESKCSRMRLDVSSTPQRVPPVKLITGWIYPFYSFESSSLTNLSPIF